MQASRVSSRVASPPRRATVTALPPRVCIVGGGFGGLYTALSLVRRSRHHGQVCTITLIEPRDRFLFTPLMYELLSDELKPWEIAPSYGELLHQTGVKHLQTRVQRWHLDHRTVHLETGDRLEYDYLVVATGSQEPPLSLPGWREHSYRFRTLADVARLEDRLANLEASDRAQIRVAVVGGGPSGVELACKVSDRLGTRGVVRLLERGDRILKPFAPRLRRTALRALARRRVQLQYHTEVSAITADTLTYRTSDRAPETQPVDLVIWAAGTQPTPWLGTEPGGETLPKAVQATLQLPSYPEVLVVGDQAQMPWQRDRPAPRTAQAAYQAAEVVAHNLVALMQGRSLKSFRYLHLGDMMTLGKGNALVSSFGLVFSGAIAGLVRQVVYLQRLPTLHHRWQVLTHRVRTALGSLMGFLFKG